MNARIGILAPLAISMFAGLAAAQPVVFTQWKFNSATGQITNNPAPSTGQGTAVPLGMTNNYLYYTSPQRTGSFTMCDVASAGASGDTASSPNNCWRVRGSFDTTLANAGIGWSIFAPQYTQGAEFDVSTLNYSGIVFTFDWFCTNQGVHNMQVQYSTNGGGTWINTGGILVSPTNGWINNLTFDFSSIPAVDDNPNFRVRLVSVYDPTYTGPNAPTYTGASGGQYNNASGNWRFDRVTFTGTAIRTIGPAITGAVTPTAVCASGGPLLFTANVQGGANPASTALAVTANLTNLGLSASQAFFDDGSNGDLFPGDGTFSYAATVPGGRPLGPTSVSATVTDAQSRSASINIPVIVGDCSGNSPSQVVISQTFGGGGNLGAQPSDDAPYDADFVELYNRSNQAVSLNGWTVQYASQASATGFDNTGDQVVLSGTIQPGQYLLVRMSDPVPGFNALPTPDFAQLRGFGGMGNTGGRVALVRSVGLIGTNYTSSLIEDFVGYGAGAANFEGVAPTATPNPSSKTAVLRKLSGVQDSNQNFNDFTTGAPTPRNRATGGFLAGYPAANTSAVCIGSDVTFTCSVSPATNSTGIQVFADVSQIIGSAATTQLFDDGPAGGHGDAQLNDGIYTRTYTIPFAVIQGNRTVSFTVTDQQNHTDTSSVHLDVGTCNSSSAPVVISQVYGGGGNNGSGFNGDFAELFNRSNAPVNLTGWSFQSARIADAGFDSRIAFLSGIIQPGEYRLIVTNQLSATGAALPTADFNPSPLFGMESSFGRVALVSTGNLLHGDWTRSDVVDLMGYGTGIQSFEGVAPAGTLGDIFVAVRKSGGCQDFNQNAIDFDVVLALTLPHNSASAANPCPIICVADVDDGSGTGTRDGGVGIEDLLYYLGLYDAGVLGADVDDGSGTGIRDGGVGIEDLLYYLGRYDAGC